MATTDAANGTQRSTPTGTITAVRDMTDAPRASLVLLKMTRGQTDEGTCRTDTLSDCSYVSDHEQHGPELPQASVGSSSSVPPALLSESATDDSQPPDAAGAGDGETTGSPEGDIPASPPRAAAVAGSLTTPTHDGDEDLHEALSFELSSLCTGIDHIEGHDDDDEPAHDLAHPASASCQRTFLLRGMSEPDLTVRDRLPCAASTSGASVSDRMPFAPSLDATNAIDPHPLPSRHPVSRSVSVPLTRDDLLPVSILKTRLSDASSVKTSRFSWKVLPKPNIVEIHRRLSEPIRCIDRSLFDPSSGEMKRRASSVSFHAVQIRHYAQTIGDNPSVSYGPPISLDWHYEEKQPVQLDVYEETRLPRRNMRQMILNYYQRRNILTWQYGATEDELRQAKREAKKIKNRRAVTNAFLPAMAVETVLESAGRKAKRVFGTGSAKKTSPTTNTTTNEQHM